MFHIIMGLPGTGKTSAVVYLAQKLPARLMRLDDIYARMFPIPVEKLPRLEGERRLNAAYAKMNIVIGKAYARFPEKNFVVEGVFRSAKRRRLILESILQTGAPVSILLLTAQREVTHKRIEERHAAGISRCDVSVYERARAEFQAVRLPHHVIDNSGSLVELHAALDRYLAELGAQPGFRSGQA